MERLLSITEVDIHMRMPYKEVTGEYSDFSLICHNFYQKNYWLNEFGGLTAFITTSTYIILVVGKCGRQTDLADKGVVD